MIAQVLLDINWNAVGLQAGAEHAAGEGHFVLVRPPFPRGDGVPVPDSVATLLRHAICEGRRAVQDFQG